MPTKKKQTAKYISRNILIPYYKELNKRGLSGVLSKEYKQYLYTKMMKVRSSYKNILSPKDTLNILIMALDHPFLKKINQTTNPQVIFFSRASLVEQYLREKKNKNLLTYPYYYIKDHRGKKVDKDKFGYLKRIKYGFKFIPPEDRNAPYYQVKWEMQNRLKGIRNEKFDGLFEDDILKRKYLWMTGTTGEKNEYIY